MRIAHKTGKLRAAFFWMALMLLLAGPAEISAAPKRFKAIKAGISNTLAGSAGASVGASVGASAAQGAVAAAKPATQATAATAKPAPQATQPHQEEAYRYNSEGRIDPFRPFVDLEAAVKK